MTGKYPVITLCGGPRFKDEFMEAQKKLTLEGNIVISVVFSEIEYANEHGKEVVYLEET